MNHCVVRETVTKELLRGSRLQVCYATASIAQSYVRVKYVRGYLSNF